MNPPFENMQPRLPVRTEDLFLELANHEDSAQPTPRHARTLSRAAMAAKHRSLPPPASDSSVEEEEYRPKTMDRLLADGQLRRTTLSYPDVVPTAHGVSVHPNRRGDDSVGSSARLTSSRMQGHYDFAERTSSVQSRFVDRTRSPVYSSAGARRLSMASTSPDAPKTHHRRFSTRLHEVPVSFGHSSFERKQSLPDTASIDSTTAPSTVWDELDELKSRIKKLELTGKLPATSGGVFSTEQSERPRTATTAPTTIDSSPKHDKMADSISWTERTPGNTAESGVANVHAANIHPLLHSALSKAKPLLNATLYRQLEATATDALQLAAMAGSSGPQGTTFSAASFMSGVAISDRHIRRKADSMCRNLTELTLALCEGKHESPSMISSPVDLTTPTGGSPTIRFSRSSLSRTNSISRPMSRLEARRSTILGLGTPGNFVDSAVESGGELSASEQEPLPVPTGDLQSRRLSRAGSRLNTARVPRYDDLSGDDEPIARPLSRARTEASNSRLQIAQASHRTPSLRESLAARRAEAAAGLGTHDQTPHRLSRMASLPSADGRRRLGQDSNSTPPVMEEFLPNAYDSNELNYDHDATLRTLPTSSSSKLQHHSLKRRMNSIGSFSLRRPTESTPDLTSAGSSDLPSRTASLQQRRRIVAE